MLLMIDNYDSFTYNIVQYFGELGQEVQVYRNDAISVADIARLKPEYLVISPGPCAPAQAGISLAAIREFAGKIPLLGVCLGHQSIGEAFGGKVVHAKQLMHGKVSPVQHKDVGVFKGGSVVLLNEVFAPDALLALELNPLDKPPLQRYLASRGRGRVTFLRGIDQANRKAVHTACDRAFGDAPIDLVIDDASHWYPQTLATFTALFPRLAPGGLYVIEDWGWAHWPGLHWQVEFGGAYFADKLPVSNLIVDLALLSAALPDAFPRIAFDSVSIYVERGAGEIARDFDVGALVHNRGQPLPRFAPGRPAQRRAFESPEFVFRLDQR